jgi:hypothetical protein
VLLEGGHTSGGLSLAVVGPLTIAWNCWWRWRSTWGRLLTQAEGLPGPHQDVWISQQAPSWPQWWLLLAWWLLPTDMHAFMAPAGDVYVTRCSQAIRLESLLPGPRVKSHKHHTFSCRLGMTGRVEPRNMSRKRGIPDTRIIFNSRPVVTRAVLSASYVV